MVKLTGAAEHNGDLFTIVGVNAFGVTGVAVSMFDFLMIQARTLPTLNLLGVMTFVLGLALELSARRALGRRFTVRVKTVDGQTLVQSGPYRFIRHPLYLGIIIVYFSGPLAWLSAYGALAVLPIVPLFLRRISLEEKAVVLRFGDGYEAYARRTKKLVPFVY